MSKNINQIFISNPASSMLSTDLLYLGRSPYNSADDFAITFANFLSSISPSTAWNASTNTPTLVNSTIGPQGALYLVDVAGSTTLNGTSGWQVGDYAYFTGGVWTKLQMIESSRVQNLTNKTLQTGGVLSGAPLVDGGNIYNQWQWDLTALGGSLGNIQRVLNTFAGAALVGWQSGNYQVVGDNLVQSLNNKSLNDQSTTFYGNDVNTKTMQFTLAGKTANSLSTWVLNGGDQQITVPSGDFTIATTTDATRGNVTSFVVGLNTTDAPYTSINTAGAAANSAATVTNNTIVYIQAGKYPEDIIIYPNVRYCGLTGSPDVYAGNLAVIIDGTVTFSNSGYEAHVENIQFQKTAATGAIFSDATTNSIVLNMSNCRVSGNTGVTPFGITNNNFKITGFHNSINAFNGSRTFDVTGGYYNFIESTIVTTDSTACARFQGAAQVILKNCYINDSIELNNTSTLNWQNNYLLTNAFLSGIVLQDATASATVQGGALNVIPGVTNYAISGAVGAAVKLNNVIYEFEDTLDPNLVVTAYAQNCNLGNPTVKTTAGDVTLTAINSIIAINKTVGAATVVNLPAVGSSVGQIYTIVDQKRDAATHNITITPASGNINGAATYVMNINGQSVRCMDFGNEYTII